MSKVTDENFAQRLIYGVCSSLLASLGAVAFQFLSLWLADLNWWFVAGCAAFGFLIGWSYGQDAIDFLVALFVGP